MGSYFHVIERKVGGNLDAFRRELGRLRESGHFRRDRHERIMRIAKTVGFGHIVRQCLVDTAVCRAQSKEAAVAQLLPEMRDCVEYVSQRWAMRDCYPNPKGILRDEVI